MSNLKLALVTEYQIKPQAKRSVEYVTPEEVEVIFLALGNLRSSEVEALPYLVEQSDIDKNIANRKSIGKIIQKLGKLDLQSSHAS